MYIVLYSILNLNLLLLLLLLLYLSSSRKVIIIIIYFCVIQRATSLSVLILSSVSLIKPLETPRSLIRTCGLYLIWFHSVGLLFLNLCIWELNCCKRDRSNWKDRCDIRVEINELGSIHIFDFWYQHRQVATNFKWGVCCGTLVTSVLYNLICNNSFTQLLCLVPCMF